MTKRIKLELTEDQARLVSYTIDKVLFQLQRSPRANTAEYAFLARLSDKLQKQAGLKIAKVS